MPREDKPKSLFPRRRIVLKRAEVVKIYEYKLMRMRDVSYRQSLGGAKHALHGKSDSLAKKFGVSPKTIRDVWSHRTWRDVTMPMWARDGGVQMLEAPVTAVATPLSWNWSAEVLAAAGEWETVAWDWGMPPAIEVEAWKRGLGVVASLPQPGLDSTLNYDWASLAPMEDPFHGDWALW